MDFGKVVITVSVGMWYFADNPREYDPVSKKMDWVPPMNRRARNPDNPFAPFAPGSAMWNEPLCTLFSILTVIKYHMGSVALFLFALN